MTYRPLLALPALVALLAAAPAARAAEVSWYSGKIPTIWKPGDTLVLKASGRPGAIRFYKCNKPVDGGDGGPVAISAERLSYVSISNCKIRNYMVGIQVRQGFEVQIVNNDIENVGRVGIWVLRGKDMRVSFNRVHARGLRKVAEKNCSECAAIKLGNSDTNGAMIEADVTQSVELEGNDVGWARDGIDVDGGDDHDIWNNWSGNNLRNGIEMDHATNARVAWNVTEYNGRHGLSLEHVSDCELWGNTSRWNDYFDADDPKHGKGFRFKDATRVSVHGNTFECTTSG